MTVTEFAVTGMTCGHCETAIRTEVGLIPGVERIDVSAATGRLLVHTAAPAADPAALDRDVLAAVDEAGYTAERA
ncbi:heavy-metal-associated domain-containing protein [Glycomyces paridis]|uniref:Heavy-metal-associated domain-containing protein n=1 Tax=Glycomyces paridis TaxID=2126555 RepID=A0A4S8PF70_9ACTN|nr:heavy-metal-associated domain-containing protein [Glycomyces paridis]THV29073.1 heavy-metal-associated domain-containing protein [Glycomyces paridis]